MGKQRPNSSTVANKSPRKKRENRNKTKRKGDKDDAYYSSKKDLKIQSEEVPELLFEFGKMKINSVDNEYAEEIIENLENSWQRCLTPGELQIIKNFQHLPRRVVFVLGSEPKPVECERLPLMCKMGVFCRILQGGERRITLPGIQLKEFHVIIELAYTGHVRFDSMQQCYDVYKTATDYGITELSEICLSYMWRHIQPNNVLQIIELARKIQEKRLENTAWMVLEREAVLVLQSSDFENADQDLVYDIVTNDNLNIPSELFLFEYIKRWGEKKAWTYGYVPSYARLKDVLDIMLPHIRYLSMSVEDFGKGPDALFTKSERDAIIHHINNPGSKMVTLPETVRCRSHKARSYTPFTSYNVYGCKIKDVDKNGDIDFSHKVDENSNDIRDTFDVFTRMKMPIYNDEIVLGIVLPSQIPVSHCRDIFYDEICTIYLYDDVTHQCIFSQKVEQNVTYNSIVNVPFIHEIDINNIDYIKERHDIKTILSLKILHHVSGEYPALPNPRAILIDRNEKAEYYTFYNYEKQLSSHEF